jgi:hypothetical protein
MRSCGRLLPTFFPKSSSWQSPPMPIRPEEFYAAAQELNRLRPPLISDEVCARTMSSRMYYAAYLAVREAIRAQVGDRTFDTTHTSLVRALTHAADPEVQAVGARLKRLKTIRERFGLPRRTEHLEGHGCASSGPRAIRSRQRSRVIGPASPGPRSLTHDAERSTSAGEQRPSSTVQHSREVRHGSSYG